MRFERISLLRYGGFTDAVLELPRSDIDFHLIVGANEAGKSTMRRALSELLFGIDARTPFGWKHGYPDMRLAARVSRGSEQLDFIRTKGNKNTLRDAADVPIAEAVLQALLGRVDQRFFERMYALDQAGLVAGGRTLLSASDDLGKMLFQSAAGLSRLGEMAQSLESKAEALWAPKKKAGRAYYDALDAYDSADKALKASIVRSKDWAQAHTEHAAADAEHARVSQQRGELAARITGLQRIRRVRADLERLAALEQQIADAAGVIDLGENARATLDGAQRLIFAAQQEQATAAALLDEIHQQIAALPVDQRLLDSQAEIAALNDRRVQLIGFADELKLAEAELAAQGVQALRLAQALGLPEDSEAGLRTRMPRGSTRATIAALAQDHAALRQALATAQAGLDTRERSLDEMRRRRAALGPLEADAGLAVALAAAARLGDVQARADELAAQLQAAQTARHQAVQALGHWPLDEAGLRSLQLPHADAVRQHLQALQSMLADGKAAHTRLHALRDERATLAATIANFAHAHKVVSEQQVAQARAERDTLWSSFEAEPAAVQAEGVRFRQLMHGADTLSDERLAGADDEGILRGQQERLRVLDAQIDELQLRQTALGEQAAGQQAAWVEQMRAAGVPGLSAEEMADWKAQRLATLAAFDEAARVADLQAGWQRQAADLAAALMAHVAAEVGEAPPLALLIERGRRVQKAAENAAAQARELDTQIVQAETERLALQSACEQARQALEAWAGAWQAALQEADFPPIWQPGQAQPVLQRYAELEAALAAMDRLRRDTLQRRADQAAVLVQDAQALLARLDGAPAPDPAGALAAVAALHERAQQAARHQQALHTPLQRQRALQDRLEAAAAQLQQGQAALQPLMIQAAAPSLEALAARVAASDALRALHASRAGLEAALVAAGDGLSLTELRRESAAIDASRLVVELQDLEAQDHALVAALSALAARRQQAQTALDAISGSANAAKAEGDRQQAIATMADAIEDYIQVKTAEKLLKWAIERYREAQQGPMLANASRHFRLLTLGSFERLTVEFEHDPPKLEGRRPDGRQVSVEGMSDGTRDQLFLALRLAGLEMQLDGGPGLPFIADDLFVNFDDQRSAAGLRALGELARKTQVIFLTHHEHLVAPAQNVLGAGLNVVRL
ncbi:ATP-binding protein [Aquabacterium sp.]|uniref:ATP-binding protein n=1 Tax=Aquabacterium sp. TaxID=1872578 RepID=UPI002BE2A53C|nr:AAA family ATPase [Aquabacterium sp.]HSW05638.1 AAA family ATPase [Aquabacterium sp.]